MPSPTTTESRTTGSLRIGDQWNAISIIAHSQTHPLKAICELVENAIDAKAKEIQIVRRKVRGEMFLEVTDDGRGVVLDDDDMPDFSHIATHICDSMKRQLSTRDRSGVHGEFGIGLLSFWTLGEELRMTSGDADGGLHELTLKRGRKTYSVSPVRGEFDMGGTRIVVGPLLASTRNIVTGDKLQKYLSAELRDRIRDRRVDIEIVDRVSRKTTVVRPLEFTGDRLSEFREVSFRGAKLSVDLYLRSSGDPKTGKVSVGKDGTRVLEDVTELIQFDRAPWNDGRLEGILDFPSLNLAPGTRRGVVPDDHLERFIKLVSDLEPEVAKAIEQRDKAATAKANRVILRQVKRAFVDALRQLEDQYLYFDVPEGTGRRRKQGDSRQQNLPTMPAVETETAVPTRRRGQLDTLAITPRHSRRPPGSKCLLVAKAYDPFEELEDGVDFEWELVEGSGTIQPDGNKCWVKSRREGRVVVEVTASKGIREAVDRVGVKFIDADDDDFGSTKGLPTYRLKACQGESWRSKFDIRRNEIVINSAHRDFAASQSSAAKHRRYIGKLYAKEVVLINFPHESSSEAMERLIEVIVRTEDLL